jgi:hypothetical protein
MWLKLFTKEIGIIPFPKLCVMKFATLLHVNIEPCAGQMAA